MRLSRAMSGTEGPEATTSEKQPGFSLASILNGDHDNVPERLSSADSAQNSDEETSDNAPARGFCVECEGESIVYPFMHATAFKHVLFKINPHNSTVKHVQMSSAKFASRRSTGKVHVNDTLQNAYHHNHSGSQGFQMAIIRSMGNLSKKWKTK